MKHLYIFFTVWAFTVLSVYSFQGSISDSDLDNWDWDTGTGGIPRLRPGQTYLRAQEACAIPGPRGFRGERGDVGPEGPRGPTGLPGILGAQIELIQLPYSPQYAQGVALQTLTTGSDNPLLSRSLYPNGLYITRNNTRTILTAVVDVTIACTALSGNCDWLITDVFRFQAAISIIGRTSESRVTFDVPVNLFNPATNATQSVFLQEFLEPVSTPTYVNVLINKVQTPDNGRVYITGNLVASIFYQDLLNAPDTK